MKRKTESLPIVSVEPKPSVPELHAWALVELFGHQRIVGYLSTETFGASVLFRIDVPDLLKNGEIERKGFTRYFGTAAIYSITPIDETAVRAMLPSIDGRPARPLHLGGPEDW